MKKIQLIQRSLSAQESAYLSRKRFRLPEDPYLLDRSGSYYSPRLVARVRNRWPRMTPWLSLGGGQARHAFADTSVCLACPHFKPTKIA